MKTTLIYRNLFTGLAIVIVTVFFASCKKNTIDPSGQFNIKVVNASPAAGPQSFTLADNVLVSGGLNFMNVSPYITAPSGKNMISEFKNEGTNSVYASGSLYTANGVSFTVFLAGKGSSARVKNFEDDLGAPNNGKVKVKFIHLSDNAPSDVKIKNSAGDELVSNISRNIASGYKFVDPGTLSVQLVGLASRNVLGNFSFPNLQAGKIYTLYFTDDVNGNLIMNEILYN
ncbi:DUF4397 domain-containing protein [Mucilaginibacter sp. SP1R1]|uniref:DUF4397 domain-containing protein n=1 Tax=Mucilaginibacter sp. SP1R1 TaxID=2723091 RepID=UPI001609DEBA|nr:DUF4397 domain-containing protein [Mucilaginibacter sp. SP1R1]MBB6148037.1 hypothetical protein [Mucilaginibacter sp. SP1R1]